MATAEAVTTFFGTLQAAGVNPPPGFAPAVAAAIWAAALPEVTDAQLRAGALLWLRSEKGHLWPTPRSVLDLVASSTVPTCAVETVWEAVLRAVRTRGFYYLTDPNSRVPELSSDAAQQEQALAAVRSLGGWGALCRCEESELPHYRRTFLQTMESLQARERQAVTGELYTASVQRIEQRQAQRDQRALTEQGAESARMVSALAERMKAGAE